MKPTHRLVLAAVVTPVVLAVAAPVAIIGALLATAPSVEERADALFASQEAAWEDRERTGAALESANPEFALLWRLFTVLALCDRALDDPDETDRALSLADDIIRDIVQSVEDQGQRSFLLGYADHRPWLQPEAGSLFVDGEVALMIAARRVVRDEPWLAELGTTWTARVERDFSLAEPSLPESYPDEAWAFCITSALLALRMHDHVEGTDHSGLIDAYTERLATSLIDPETGLIGSDWHADGRALDGTEGSSIWWVSTVLLLLDPDLAAEQYEGAREQLLSGFPGLAWSREWPVAQQRSDIDSGPVIPLLNASPAASGFALVAASAHNDDAWRERLVRSLRAADVLLVADPRLSQMAEAPMGDAIVMAGLGFGPLWERVSSP